MSRDTSSARIIHLRCSYDLKMQQNYKLALAIVLTPKYHRLLFHFYRLCVWWGYFSQTLLKNGANKMPYQAVYSA